MEKIHFEKASFQWKPTIFNWLKEPHILEFWDTSEAHKADIVNFMEGRSTPSDYCNGQYVYWIGVLDTTAYCMIMAIAEVAGEKRPQIKNEYLSSTGSTYSLDFMIGNSHFLGKGLGAKTLEAFVRFFQNEVDSRADTFFIDPDIENPRARHVYEKAGFQYVGDFIMEGNSSHTGRLTHFLVKKLPQDCSKRNQ